MLVTWRLIPAWAPLIILWAGDSTVRADWPQAMGGPRHVGQSPDSLATERLGLLAQVELDDAILAGPALVGDQCFVVDQMGTAYSVDIATGRVRWRRAPAADPLVGGNASGPAVAKGRVYFGTTAGELRILDAKTGEVVKSVDLGSPVISPVTVAGETVYVPTVDSRVLAFDLEGHRKWVWDHYRLSRRMAEPYEPASDGDVDEHPHYGGAPIAVAGDRVVAPLGYDLVCLRDEGDGARELWRTDRPLTKYDVPLGAAIAGKHVYCTWPKSDGQGGIVRHRLRDGAPERSIPGQWAVLTPPAVIDGGVCFSRLAFGVSRWDVPTEDEPPKLGWLSFSATSESLTPSVASVAVTPTQAVATTLDGKLHVWPLEKGPGAVQSPSYTFETASGAMISSAPALSEGRVCFGSDDGCLYILGPGGEQPPRRRKGEAVARRRSAPPESPYEWPAALGDADNDGFSPDASVRPPFKLKWAMPAYGCFKHPVCVRDGDIVSVSLAGLVVCREQSTGRIRWRHKLAGQAWSRASLLVADGKIFVPRVSSPRYPFVLDQPDALYCLDQETGALKWMRRIGRSDWLRASPVYLQGVVAYGSKYETPQGATPLIGAAAAWRFAWDAPAEDWTAPEFDAAEWERGLVGVDKRFLPSAEAGREQSDTVYLRGTFQGSEIPVGRKLGLVAGPDDALRVYLNGQEIHRSRNWGGKTVAASASYVGRAADYLPLELPPGLLRDGPNMLCIAARRARVKSNVSSSTSVFPPRLVAAPANVVLGPVVEAWDAETGRPRWQLSVTAGGEYIEGPAGCSDGKRFYFTGGGTGRGGKGATYALEPKSGDVLWKTDAAYACRTGAPSIRDGRLYLPGVLNRPLACLDATSGEVLWENAEHRSLTFVHGPALGEDFLTVNTKYVGGARCFDLATGRRVVVEGRPLDLSGGGHGCGSVVLLASGHAIATTNKGLYFTDVNSGRVVWKTPGFASQTCPHPAIAGGHLFYAPQNNGVLYCFEPVR